MTDSVPEKLGKYKIIAEVGRGGFAAVYKAVDTTLDRTVALKVLAPHLLWDPTFVQRFQREAEVAANLDHPHIVTIYEVGQIEGVYLIAMQFLEGRTLSQILEAEGSLPVSRVQAIVEQVASALDYAHARDFVHRDVKPSNVIVADDGRATLTDFGLVKAGEGTKLSTTGVVFGTPQYMSPEQAEGKALDARSDVYSLGVVLFEMLAGRAPFVADTTPAVMYKHVHEPPPLDELPSDLPQGVVAVVEKALAKKREARYQSAGEMAAALQQAVSGAVVEKVIAPPVPALHPSLTLQLSVEPQTVDAGSEAKWTVTLHNDGDDDLRHVTVRRGRTLLDEPFDLAAGKGRRFTFTTTYKTEGRKAEKVTTTGIASTGESVRDEARATVRVTPIPPEPEVPVPPAPKAIPKKALGWGALLAGGLVLLGILCIIVFVISYIAALTPTPAPPVGAETSTKAPTPTESPIPPTPEPTPTPTPELATKVPTPTESPIPPMPEPTPTPTPTPLVVPVPEGGGMGKIAFYRIFGDGIYILNPDGSRNRLARLSDQPAWSPDGRRLVFLRYDETSNFPNQIYIMQADGTGETPLTSNRANNHGPVWSPDGKQIAFSSGERGKQDLYLINVDGTGLKNLTNSPDTGDRDPTWSPDGERIAFSSNRDGYYDIHIMNADGTQSFPLKTGAAPAGFPAWSPDGTRIAFESERDGNTEIYVINIDGTGLKNLTNNPATDGDPAWSPNSARIAFASSRGNRLDIYVMNADGTQVIRLTNNGGNYGPVWQP